VSEDRFETSNFFVEKRILGVLGGQDVDDRVFKFWAQSSDILVAADAGADLALRHGVTPHAIIGDLDSVSADALASGADIYKFEDESTTDCDKLLVWVGGQGHRTITLIGVEGDRLDHVLSTLSSCARSPLRIQLVLRDGVGLILKPGEHKLTGVPGQRISILPIGVAGSFSAEGVRWPVHEADFSLDRSLSVSNEFSSPQATLRFVSGALLAVIESPNREPLDILNA
jgi:thiamine pyrophosphokinase